MKCLRAYEWSIAKRVSRRYICHNSIIRANFASSSFVLPNLNLFLQCRKKLTPSVISSSSARRTNFQLNKDNAPVASQQSTAANIFLDYYAAQIVCGLVPEWMHMSDLSQNLLATTTTATTARKNI